MTDEFLSGARQQRFLALQARLVPLSTSLPSTQRDAGLALVNDLVGRMPEKNRRKLGVFLLLIDFMGYALMLRPFARLPYGVQTKLLQFLFDGPVGLLRKGFWGVNSLAKLSVYGQPELYDQIGYRPRVHRHD